ncbi:MAG TPA: hypothetical protein VK892_18975 [Pyrinomonadaceae bacterium]|nr:hypothetical protein [Pyrinomonadaceae bacterium]
MSKKSFQVLFRLQFFLFCAFFISGCAVEAAKTERQNGQSSVQTTAAEKKNSPSQSKITITSNSPADTVRVFYKNLREKRFREAIFLTNLRPAIEGLTDSEMQDLQVDFANLARNVPAEIPINGEITSGDSATVTAKFPNDDTGKIELKEFKLKRENGAWKILLADETTEAAIKKEGKNYFFNLKIQVHHSEAKAMIERIAKAQMVYAVQNGGLYGEMKALIESGFLPADAQTSASTGYNYSILLSPDKKKYSVTAEPAVYGKTGKLSFLFEVAGDKKPALKSADNQGKSLKNE